MTESILELPRTDEAGIDTSPLFPPRASKLAVVMNIKQSHGVKPS